jgi:creatinine amidohydrolase
MVKRVEEITWEEAQAHLEVSDVAVVPVGVLEPHGSHGPLGFDSYIAEEIGERLAEASNAFLLPTLKYGCCTLGYDWRNWPISLGISVETLTGLYTEIGLELSRWGIRRIVFVNGHVPNHSILDIAASKIWSVTGTAVGILDWWSGAPRETSEMKGYGYGTHADQVETSILLATKASKMAKMDRATATKPHVSPEEWEMYVDKVRYTRKMDERWVGKSANFDDPTKASREVGEKIISATVQRGLRLLKALEHNVAK